MQQDASARGKGFNVDLTITRKIKYTISCYKQFISVVVVVVETVKWD